MNERDKTCADCGEALSTMIVRRSPGGERWAEHSCGTLYSPEFMRDHFGINWADDQDRVRLPTP